VDACEKVNWGINYQGNIRFLKKLIFKELSKMQYKRIKEHVCKREDSRFCYKIWFMKNLTNFFV
jgi:hypothetical protein